MSRFDKNGNKSETEAQPTYLPAVESFLNPEIVSAVWPVEVVTNPEFVEQTTKRREASLRLAKVASRLQRPDIKINEAIQQGLVDRVSVNNLYQSIEEILVTKDGVRLALYLPFEYLPDVHDSDPGSVAYRNTYKDAWQSLLTSHDVRANFVDGDVLEPELLDGADHTRVVKAAHMIPKLIEAEIISLGDIDRILNETSDVLLRKSIADTIPVLIDMGYLDLDDARSHPDALVRNVAQKLFQELEATKLEVTVPDTSLTAVKKRIDAGLKSVAETEYADIPEARANWLKKDTRLKVISGESESVASGILSRTSPGEYTDLSALESADTPTLIALVKGITKAIEQSNTTSVLEATKIFGVHKMVLLKIWEHPDQELRSALVQTYSKLNKLGLVSKAELDDLGISLPSIGGPYSENTVHIDRELSDLREMLRSLESRPELANLVYPVAIVTGSRVKGYGTAGSDLDVSVFIKPGINENQKGRIRELLMEVFSGDLVSGKVLEFWLRETPEGLSVIDNAEFDVQVGDSTLAEVLFSGIWEGRSEIIKTLFERLLTPYLYKTQKMINGLEAHSVYMQDLERAIIQYRLMHNGYSRYYPAYGGIDGKHKDSIDGSSAFWDSGYRQVATKLFVERVFLPEISKVE